MAGWTGRPRWEMLPATPDIAIFLALCYKMNVIK